MYAGEFMRTLITSVTGQTHNITTRDGKTTESGNDSNNITLKQSQSVGRQSNNDIIYERNN